MKKRHLLGMMILLVGLVFWITTAVRSHHSSMDSEIQTSLGGRDKDFSLGKLSASNGEGKPITALLKGDRLSESQRFRNQFSTISLSTPQSKHSFAEDSDFFIDYPKSLEPEVRQRLFSWLEGELFPSLQSIEDGNSETFLFGDVNAFVQIAPFSDDQVKGIVSNAENFATQFLVDTGIGGAELGRYLRLVTGYIGLNRLAVGSVQNTRSGERDVVAFHTFANPDDRITKDGSGAIAIPVHTKFLSDDSSSVLGKRSSHLFGFSEPTPEAE